MISLKYMFEQESYGIRPDMVRPKLPRIPVEPAPGSPPPVEEKKKKPIKPLNFKSKTLSGANYKPPKPFKVDDRAAGGFPSTSVGRLT